MNHVKAVVLAAGKGTRLQSEKHQLPKVMRLANGRPLLAYVLDALNFLDKRDIIIVAGFMRQTVMDAFDGYPFAIQEKQLGTGHAVMAAADFLEKFGGTVLACYGDMPLLSREVYLRLLERHDRQGNACTLLSGTCAEDLPYGRVIRDSQGGFMQVVEDQDCTREQKQIRELNAGIYAFSCFELLQALQSLNNDNSQGEYYLTDVPGLLLDRGKKVGVYAAELNEQIIGVNTAEQLSQVEAYLSRTGR